MHVPIHSDPEVLERLYERYPYLAYQPLGLHGPGGDLPHVGTLAADDLLAFVTAADVRAPYPPAVTLLTPAENRGLCRYAQLQVLEPRPQPLVEVAWPSAGAGVASRIGRVDVLLNPVGDMQLWYGGGTGVLWGARFWPPVGSQLDHAALLHRFWGLCERYLAERGVRFVYTPNRDPAFEPDGYAAFLAARGYRPDPARDHLPGGWLAAVKDLDVFYGGDNG